jgi:plasmid maintenance system antidote protein VapI
MTGEEYVATVGSRLRAEIADAGWTVNRTARVTGIPRSTLRRRLLTGKRLSVVNTVQVLEVLGRCNTDVLTVVMSDFTTWCDSTGAPAS